MEDTKALKISSDELRCVKSTVCDLQVCVKPHCIPHYLGNSLIWL